VSGRRNHHAPRILSDSTAPRRSRLKSPPAKKCSVRPLLPALDQHLNASRRSLTPKSLLARQPHLSPAKRFARSLIASPADLRQWRAAGVPGRFGNRGNTMAGKVRPALFHQIPVSATKHPLRFSRSEKPAMMSAPSAISGRSRRTCAQNSMASLAQMPPLHPLQDQIVAGLQRQMQDGGHQPLRHRLLSRRAGVAVGPRLSRSMNEIRSPPSIQATCRRICFVRMPSFGIPRQISAP